MMLFTRSSEVSGKHQRSIQPVAVILRHAERYPVVDPLTHSQVLLTEKGLEDAYNRGKVLSFLKPVTFYASPVPRCQQTAEGIAKGIFNPDGTPPQVTYLYALGGALYPRGIDGITAYMENEKICMVYHDHLQWVDGIPPSSNLRPPSSNKPNKCAN